MDMEGLRVAREVAVWHLGSSSWADLLIHAYLNPDVAREELKLEKES